MPTLCGTSGQQCSQSGLSATHICTLPTKLTLTIPNCSLLYNKSSMKPAMTLSCKHLSNMWLLNHAATDQIHLMLEYQQPQSHSSTQNSSQQTSPYEHSWYVWLLPTQQQPPTPDNKQESPKATIASPLFLPSVGLHSLELGTFDNTINWGCFLEICCQTICQQKWFWTIQLLHNAFICKKGWINKHNLIIHQWIIHPWKAFKSAF